MPFDLDAVIAERSEKPLFTFTFDGAEYSMPSDIDVEVLDLLTEGDAFAAMELLIGADEWAQIVASDKLLGAIALGELIEAYMKHIGIGLGESSASTRSSRRAARPSKRTSSGSTGSVSVISEPGSPGGDSES